MLGESRWPVPGASERWLRLGLIALAAVLFGARLGERSLWSMEVRWGEIPREMRASGDYFTPTINGRLYYDKPLGSYWLVLAASALCGEVNEFAARLPSALAAVLAVWLIVRIGRRLFDSETGLLAGLILATSFSFVGFARTASADMENVAGVLAALALFLEGGERPRAWRIVAIWAVMAATSLTKGLLGFALPLLIIGADSVLVGVRQRRQWLVRWATPLGLALAAIIYLVPFLIAADRSVTGSGLGMVFRENLQRFFAPHNHKGPVYLYAYVIFALFAPWSVLLPAALWQSHARPDGTAAGRRFALVFFWATFLFFTLSASRRSYYLLPILPAAALVVARLLATRPADLAPAARFALRSGFGLLVLLTAGAAAAALVLKWLPGTWFELPAIPAPGLLLACGLACVLAALWSLRTFDSRRVAQAMGVMATAALAYVYLAALPAAEAYRGQREFARQVRAVVGEDDGQLALYRTREVVYYLCPPRPVREFVEAGDLAAAARRGEVRWAIVHERDADRLGVSCVTLVREAALADRDGTRAVLVAFPEPGIARRNEP